MKEKIISIVLIAFFAGLMDVFADSYISSSVGSGSTTLDSATCDVNKWPCYNTTIQGIRSTVGIRFTIVNADGTAFRREDGSIAKADLLNSDFNSLLDAVNDKNIIAMKNLDKASILASSWSYQYPSGHIEQYIVNTNSGEIKNNTTSLSGYMDNFKVQVTPTLETTTLYNIVFGTNNKLVSNYNSGNDDAGDVFTNGNDKIVFQYAVLAMLGEEYGDSAPYPDSYGNISEYADAKISELKARGSTIIAEFLTIIDYKSKDYRYLIYGTTAEIRAIAEYLAARDVSYNKSGFPNVFNNVSMHSLFLGNRGNASLYRLNRNWYATRSLGGYQAGSNEYCNLSDWILDNHFACGVGIIDVDATESKSCVIETNELGSLYYGPTGQRLNDSFTIPAEEFINQCVCDTSSNTHRDSYDQLHNTYSFLWAEGSDTKTYMDNHCEQPSEDTPTTGNKVCNPQIENKNCNDGEGEYTIGDNLECIFGTDNVNANVFDENDESSTRKNYTYAKNEYCSQTCAEQIKLSLPTRESVIAGQYWTWAPEQITLSGTRTCQATVLINDFEDDVKNESSSDQPIRMANIYNKEDGTTQNSDDSNYGLVQQSEDLKAAYDEYKGITTDSFNETRVTTGQTTYYSNPSGTNPNYLYCKEYKYHSTTTGEDFTYWKAETKSGYYTRNGVWQSGTLSADCTGNNNTDIKSSSNSKTPSELADVFKTKFDTVVSSITNKIQEVEDCNTSLNDRKDDDYKFNPTVSFSYADSTYDNDFGGNTKDSYTSKTYNGELVPGKSSSEYESSYNIDDTAEISYYETITSTSPTSESYHTGTSNNITKTITKKYSSPVYFYLRYGNFNSGALYGTTNASEANRGYSIGNNTYPISLNQEAASLDYHIYLGDLGVDLNGTTSTGRFNKILGNKALDYTCYYDVTNDITDPEKPNFFYRNISLNNFDPNKRSSNNKLGKNWTSDKGQATIDAIATAGEKVYEEPEYSFTLTPENMQNIREYNKTNDYGDFNMNPYSLTDEAGNAVSEQNIWFRSDFLEHAIENDYAENVVLNENPFTAWSNYDESQSIGPAWK